MTWADRLVLYVVVGAAVVLLASGAGRGETSRNVIIEGASGYEATCPSNTDTEVRVPGPLGDTVVVIEDGGARVASSPCRQQVCVRMGRIARPGEVLVCVPNRVVVRLDGSGRPASDAVTR